jgi:hypothetical protein
VSIGIWKDLGGVLAGSGRDLDGIWTGSGRDLDGIWTGSGRDLDGIWTGFERDSGGISRLHLDCRDLNEHDLGGSRVRRRLFPPRLHTVDSAGHGKVAERLD